MQKIIDMNVYGDGLLAPSAGTRPRLLVEVQEWLNDHGLRGRLKEKATFEFLRPDSKNGEPFWRIQVGTRHELHLRGSEVDLTYFYMAWLG